MSIEINVEVGEIALTDHIGTKVLYDDGEQYEEPIILADVVVEKLVGKAAATAEYTSLRERIATIRDEEIRAHIAPAIAEAWAAPIQRTNVYGERRGEAVTLRELVIEEAKSVLQGSTDRSSYGRGTEPLARQIVRELVDKELRKELTSVLAEEKAKVVNAVREQAADLIAEAVTKGIGGK